MRTAGFQTRSSLALQASYYTRETSQQRRLGFIVKQNFHELLLNEQGGKIGNRQDKMALVHFAEFLKKPTPFLVNGGGNPIRKVGQSTLRVLWTRHSEGINMHHPTVSQPRQRLIDAQRDGLTFRGVALSASAPLYSHAAMKAPDFVTITPSRTHAA
jgi:hypothetical protein